MIFIRAHGLGILFLALVAILFSISSYPHAALSQSGSTITGYAWSDTIGWLSFNGTGYGISVEGDGTLSGYGWSDNIGWVSADASDLAGCPSAPCTAKLSDGNLQGWLKAVAGGGVQSGGWDGWIKLNGSNYGPVLGGNGDFSGFAWGSDVVGWLDFSNAHSGYSPCTPSAAYSCVNSSDQGGTGPGYNIIRRTDTDSQCAQTNTNIRTCQAPSFCSAGSQVCIYAQPAGAITVKPELVFVSGTTTVSWDVTSADSCTVTGTNGQNWSGTSGTHISNPITEQTTFKLHCIGPDNQTTLDDSASVNIIPVFQEI